MSITDKYKDPARSENPDRRYAINSFRSLALGNFTPDLFFKMNGDETMLIFKEYLDEEDFAFIVREREKYYADQRTK